MIKVSYYKIIQADVRRLNKNKQAWILYDATIPVLPPNGSV